MSEHTVAANAAKLNFVGAFNASGVALSNGKRYYVTVEAVNKACPELSVEVSSTAILVDNTPPFPQARDGQDLIFANRDCSVNSNEQLEADVIHACWHEFIEEESSILKYEIAVTRFVGTGDSALGNLSE